MGKRNGLECHACVHFPGELAKLPERAHEEINWPILVLVVALTLICRAPRSAVTAHRVRCYRSSPVSYQPINISSSGCFYSMLP
jgi:hypothetical protein